MRFADRPDQRSLQLPHHNDPEVMMLQDDKHKFASVTQQAVKQQAQCLTS